MWYWLLAVLWKHRAMMFSSVDRALNHHPHPMHHADYRSTINQLRSGHFMGGGPKPVAKRGARIPPGPGMWQRITNLCLRWQELSNEPHVLPQGSMSYDLLPSQRRACGGLMESSWYFRLGFWDKISCYTVNCPIGWPPLSDFWAGIKIPLYCTFFGLKMWLSEGIRMKI